VYNHIDSKRAHKEKVTQLEKEEYRSDYRIDFARLIHSPSFRRLQGKTQLFPGVESDYFRNRLTHSLEVAQIAKSIALRLNARFDNEGNPRKAQGNSLSIDTDLVEFAGLAHDLGHPPFGHQGEEALDECMVNCGGFEGNAQTFRIITKLEKKFGTGGFNSIKDDNRVGLNLTARTLASILKYDAIIPYSKKDRIALIDNPKHSEIKPVKGYYTFDKKAIKKIKEELSPDNNSKNEPFKTIECQIMDIADDIAYSTYDLEDAIKARFISPMDLLFPKEELVNKVVEDVNKALKKEQVSIICDGDSIRDYLRETCSILFDAESDEIKTLTEIEDVKTLHGTITYLFGSVYESSKLLMSDGTFRTAVSSGLVGRCIREIELIPNKEGNAIFHKVKLKDEIRAKVEARKRFVYRSIIESPRMEVVAYRGKQIVTAIFNAIAEENGWRLLPKDVQSMYLSMKTKNDKLRIICDFVASMTDRYAVEFYSRLNSTSPETIFKPF
jgi:dGTPase